MGLPLIAKTRATMLKGTIVLSGDPFHIFLSTLFRRKLKHRLRLEGLPRLQDRAREIRMIWRIREMLRLQAQAIAAFVDVALLSSHSSVQEVAGVELSSRLRRRDFQHAPAGRLINASGQYEACAFS